MPIPRKPILAANWKMHMTAGEAVEFVEKFDEVVSLQALKDDSTQNRLAAAKGLDAIENLAEEQGAEGLDALGREADLVLVAASDGTMAAARLVWGLLYAGVRCIRLLDGGIARWLDSGGATESTD